MQAKLLSNALWNAVNGSSAAVVAVLVPPFLTRLLTPEAYGAWALALQIGTYVSLFGFGIQIAVGRYVAYHETRGDIAGRDGMVATAFWFLLATSLLGWVAICGVALSIDRLVPGLAPALVAQTRWAIALVGLALAINLPASIFAAVFTGRQRSDIPAKIQGLGRLLLAAGLIVAGYSRSLGVLGLVYAIISIGTVAALAFAWRTRTPTPTLALRLVAAHHGRELAGFCFSLTVWNIAMLLVGGLDLIIIGRWDYAATPYFAVSVTLVTLLSGTLTSLANALIPAAATIPEQDTHLLRDLLERSSRVIIGATMAAGLPLIFGARTILSIWLGGRYGEAAAAILMTLATATILRNGLLPYVTIAIGTGYQRRMTVTPLIEGMVSIAAGVLLVQSVGAFGVALAKIVGGFTGIALLVGQHPLRDALGGLPRIALVTRCLARPFAAALPPAALYIALLGWLPPHAQIAAALAASFTALVSIYFIALNAGDRAYAERLILSRLRPRAPLAGEAPAR